MYIYSPLAAAAAANFTLSILFQFTVYRTRILVNLTLGLHIMEFMDCMPAKQDTFTQALTLLTDKGKPVHPIPA